MSESETRNVFVESARLLAEMGEVAVSASEIHSRIQGAEETFRTQANGVAENVARVLDEIDSRTQTADETFRRQASGVTETVNQALGSAEKSFQEQAEILRNSVAQAASDVRAATSQVLLVREETARATAEVVELVKVTGSLGKKITRTQTLLWILILSTTLLAAATFFGKMPS